MQHVGAVLSAPYTGPFFWTLVASCLQPEATRQGLQQLSKRMVSSAAEMAAALDELLELGAQALIVKPQYAADGELKPALDRALALGVPVITLDSMIAHAAVCATVGSDNFAGMQRVTRHALQALGGRGRVVYFAGDERLTAGTARNLGFRQALAEFPEVELVQVESLDWVSTVPKIATASQCMRRVLARHREFDALIAAGDEAAIGGMQVLREAVQAGQWTTPWPVVVGFNGLAEALLLVKSGEMTATIAQSPEWIARTSLEMARACRDDPLRPWSHRFVDSQLVTQANVGDYAFNFMHLVPRFIAELGESQARERQLQQQVIARQRRALTLISSATALLARNQSVEHMVGALYRLLKAEFGQLDVLVATHAPWAVEGSAAQQVRKWLEDSALFGRSWLWRPSADAAGCRRDDFTPLEQRRLGRTELHRRCSAAHAGDDRPEEALLLLLANGHCYGAIAVRDNTGRALGSELQQLLGAIAVQLALAWEAATLQEETRHLTAAELRAAQEKLVHAERAEYLANHDALTDLPNRRCFGALLERTLNEALRYERRFALCFLDLDGFKHVNDSLGHDAGDQLLQEVAARLQAAVRSTDTVARLGGDEFVVLVPELPDEEHAEVVAAKLVAAFAAPFQLGNHRVATTTSLGVALFPRHGRDMDALMRGADSAMYTAKRAGKNRFALPRD